MWAGDGGAAVTPEEITALKAQIAAQQKQIEELQQSMAAQQKLLDRAVADAPKSAAEPEAQVTSQQTSNSSASPSPFPSLGDVASRTPVVPAAAPAPGPLPQKPPAEQSAAAPASPLQIQIGGATITPVGFMDLTNTWRSTNSGASLATNFGNFPYNNTVQGRLTEDTVSAQNSRLGLRVDADIKGSHVIGYYEGDFVGQVAVNNTQVTSNSMSYRVRLYWVDVRKGPFEFLAGQSWSLLTPNRNGLSALPGDLFYGLEFDVNYLNGLTWGRIPGARFLWHAPGDKVVAGISFENSDQYLGGSGGGGIATLPAAFASTTFNNQVDANQTNDITIPRVHPDIIGKIAFQPVKPVHFEIAGIESTNRTFNSTTQQHFTTPAFGGSVNANLELVHGFRIVTNNFWSNGEGRYLFGEAPDFIILPSGRPQTLHSGSTVDGFEITAGKWQLFAYYGGIYIGRSVAVDTNGSLIGYGYRGSASSQNRDIQEITGGFIGTFWRDPRYGALQLMGQYAYFLREPWFVAANSPKEAHQNAVWINIRYVLPGSAPTVVTR